MRQATFILPDHPEESVATLSPMHILRALAESAATADVCTGYDWVFARDTAQIRAFLAQQGERPKIVLCFEGWGDPLHEMQGVGAWLFSASVQIGNGENPLPWETALGAAVELERFLRSLRFRSPQVRPEGFRARASQWSASDDGTASGYRLSFDLPVSPPAKREVTIDLAAYMEASTTKQ